jgi:tRNA dimethylallyltransferase
MGQKNDKLLVICGQTGTGKTSLAFYLADIFGGELVSADSRQVYKRLDIGTGKDLLKESRYDRRGFYDVGGIEIWGYDLVDPKREFSVGAYLKFARKAIKDITARKKLPILVGGTGLFIKAVVDGIPTALVPRNKNLRENLEVKSPREMFEILAQLDPVKAGSLNSSDRVNPRRLVRAIEIAAWTMEGKHKPFVLFKQGGGKDVLFIGLTAAKESLSVRIDERIKKRVAQGLEKEIRDLLNSGVNWNHQAMSSLGYRQWQDYFTGKKTREVVIQDWRREEKHYAKRQLTWFKKDKRIHWFDISGADFVKEVENLVKKWYSTGDGPKS